MEAWVLLILPGNSPPGAKMGLSITGKWDNFGFWNFDMMNQAALETPSAESGKQQPESFSLAFSSYWAPRSMCLKKKKKSLTWTLKLTRAPFTVRTTFSEHLARPGRRRSDESAWPLPIWQEQNSLIAEAIKRVFP